MICFCVNKRMVKFAALNMKGENYLSSKKQFDDFYSNGKLDIGRKDNIISVKNHYTPEEIKERNKMLASHMDEVKRDINGLIKKIVEKSKQCDPVFLLMTATDVTMSSLYNVVSESQMRKETIGTLGLIEYVQSILVAHSYDSSLINEDKQVEISMEIFKDYEDLVFKCHHFYLVWAADAQEKGELKREEIEYIMESQLMSNVRGHRYQFQQLHDLEKLLLPHTDKLVEIYGETGKSIIEGLRKLEVSLSSGKLESAKALMSSFEAFQTKIDGKTRDERDAILEQISKESKIQDYVSKCFGADLYNVKKVTNWDDRLIEGLAWSLGEISEFFQRAEYPGWPIQDLPVQKRPFIKIKNVVYCFDYYNLFDNIYRMLQKNIKEHDHEYVTNWADIQQGASEALVAEKLAEILPNADVYTGNYYPKAGSLKQMDENDVFIICDDVIIIVEVKAGSFTYTPAITDYSAHKRSFEALVGKADYQCIRTQNYIESSTETILFYNNDKTLKFEINPNKVRRIYTLCVTVDNFNAFEAKIEKTNFFNSSSGTIVLSIDDLDIYEDYFKSEMEFLHYLKHRKAATRMKCLMLNDELDHLGLYISQNVYEDYVNDYRDCDSFNALGFRKELDAYYAGVHNKFLAVDKPSQVIPQYITEIFRYLEKNKIASRIEFGENILDIATDERERIDRSIRERIARERQLGYLTPMWEEYDHFAMYWFVNIPKIESLSERHRKKYIYSNMLDRKQKTCWAIYIDIDNNAQIRHVCIEKIRDSQYVSEGFTNDEIFQYAQDVKARRKAHGKSLPPVHKKKTYPNDLCPCGSGKKYKKCCGKNQL